MQRNAQRIALVAGVPDEQARWKPDAESWSILKRSITNGRGARNFAPASTTRCTGPARSGYPSTQVANACSATTSAIERVAGRMAWPSATLNGGLTGWRRPTDAAGFAPGATCPGGHPLARAAHDLLHMRQLVELHWRGRRRNWSPAHVQYVCDW